MQHPVSRGCMPTITVVDFDRNAPLTSNDVGGGFVRRATPGSIRRSMLPVAPGRGAGMFFAADALTTSAVGFQRLKVAPEHNSSESKSLVNESPNPVQDSTPSRRRDRFGDASTHVVSVRADQPLTVQALIASEDGQYLYLYWADDKDIRASDAFAVASLLPGGFRIQGAVLVYSGQNVVVVALTLKKHCDVSSTIKASAKNRLVLVGIDQQTCSWRLLAELAFNPAPGADPIEGAISGSVPVATVGVYVPEVDGGNSPNRPLSETSPSRHHGHSGRTRAENSSRSIRDTPAGGNRAALVFTVAAVARSGRRLLFWDIPFDLLRGLLRRFSGHTTVFLRDSLRLDQSNLKGDRLCFLKFVAANSGSDDVTFAVTPRDQVPSCASSSTHAVESYDLRLLAVSVKGSVQHINVTVTTSFVGHSDSPGAEAAEKHAGVRQNSVTELLQLPRVGFADTHGSQSDDQPRVCTCCPTRAGDMLALVTATGPEFNPRFWLVIVQLRVADESQCSSVTPLPLPDRSAGKPGSSPVARALLKENGGSPNGLTFSLSWKSSGDGGNASGRCNVALAVAYADVLLVYSPRQHGRTSFPGNSLTANADTNSKVVGRTGNFYASLSPIIRQSIRFPDAPRGSGALASSDAMLSSTRQPSSSRSAAGGVDSTANSMIVSVTGLVWLHRTKVDGPSWAVNGEGRSSSVSSNALLVSANAHSGRSGELHNGPLLVFDTNVSARSVLHLSPEVRKDAKEIPLCCTTLDYLVWHVAKPLPHFHPDFVLEYMKRDRTTAASSSTTSSSSTHTLVPKEGRDDKWIAQQALQSVLKAISETQTMSSSDTAARETSPGAVVIVPSLPLAALYTYSGDSRSSKTAETGIPADSGSTDWAALPTLLDASRVPAPSSMSRGATNLANKPRAQELRIAGLSGAEQRRLAAVAAVWCTTLSDKATQVPNLDDCGWRFFIAHRLREEMPAELRPVAIGTNDCAWALHCRDHDGLLELVLPVAKDQRTWDTVRRFGPMLWLLAARTDHQLVQQLAMEVARAEYTQSERDPYAVLLTEHLMIDVFFDAAWRQSC